MPAAGNKVFQGDFVEKMMKGEFATGPPPSAEPAAATSHMAAPEPAQGGKGGSQGGWQVVGQVRGVRMWRSSIGLGMGGRIRTHGPNGREANGEEANGEEANGVATMVRRRRSGSHLIRSKGLESLFTFELWAG